MSARLSPQGHDDCDVRFRTPGCVVEFQSFFLPLLPPAADILPTAPGGILRDGDGRPIALYIGPGRWLFSDPGASILGPAEAAVAAGAGMMTGVEGKWRVIEIIGRGAKRLLRTAVEIESILVGRDCAAVALFDCPAIVVEHSNGYDIWVKASYFTTLIARLRCETPAPSES